MIEGVQLKHAQCTKCGYSLAGIAIKRGVIVCPECAHIESFDIAPNRSLAGYRHIAARATMVMLIIMIIGLALLFVVMVSR